MKPHGCPDPEELAVFAARGGTEASWRRVVRHLPECEVCRRQVEIIAEVPEDSGPVTTVPLPVPASRPRAWQRVAQAVAAVAVLAAAAGFLLSRPSPPPPVADRVLPPAAPERPRLVREERRRPVFPDRAPEPGRAEPPRVEHAPFLPAPRDPDEPREVSPVPPKASPFLVERVAGGVTQPIEVTVARGEMAWMKGGSTSLLRDRQTLSAADTVRAPEGGSLVLPDGATLHLAREAEVGLSWSQADACARVELRSGEALLDFGRAPKPVCLSSGAAALLLQESSGILWLSRGGSELRTTPLDGTAAFRAPGGAPRRLGALESLVLGAEGDRLEQTPDPAASLRPRFPSLEPTPAARPEPARKVPLPAELLEGLASQSYNFRVVGRLVREGAWLPPNVCVSTLEDFTAVRRIQDDQALHVKRGARLWDDVGKLPAGSREARVLETVRRVQPPHAILQELLPSLREALGRRTEQVGDRLCWVWEVDLDPAAIRDFVKEVFTAAVADGRLGTPEGPSWETLRGSLEFACTQVDPRLVRVVDRRRVAYSHKVIGGPDRRWYNLETVYEFSNLGQAASKLPPEIQRELFPPKK